MATCRASLDKSGRAGVQKIHLMQPLIDDDFDVLTSPASWEAKRTEWDGACTVSLESVILLQCVQVLCQYLYLMTFPAVQSQRCLVIGK